MISNTKATLAAILAKTDPHDVNLYLQDMAHEARDLARIIFMIDDIASKEEVNSIHLISTDLLDRLNTLGECLKHLHGIIDNSATNQKRENVPMKKAA